MRDMFDEMRDLSDEERRERFDEIRSKIEAMNADVEKQLKKVLLPHQFDRLKQIDLQTRIQQRGAAALTSGDLAEDTQPHRRATRKTEKRAPKCSKNCKRKIRQLQAEARKKMLDVLTPEQQAKLEKLMGDQFDLPRAALWRRIPRPRRSWRTRRRRRRGDDRGRSRANVANAI